MSIYSKIIATGGYVPSRVLANSDFEKMIDTTDEWIFSRSGIKTRHIVDENEKTSDMAFSAAMDAINSSGLDKKQIDLILVATSTPDMIFPSTACLIQSRLGLNDVPAFDLQAACTGFMYALTTADCYIKSGQAQTVLVVGADTVSRFIDYTDRNTCVLFGDGAGAAILQVSSESGIIANEMHADGSGFEILNAPAQIYNGKIVGHPFIKMDGKAVFKRAVNNLADLATNILSKSGYTGSDLDWLIPHQANIRIIEATAKHLNLPMTKVIVTVDKHGNTSAASVPLALNDAVKSGKIKRGDLLLLEGVGAGFTWGASLVRY